MTGQGNILKNAESIKSKSWGAFFWDDPDQDQ